MGSPSVATNLGREPTTTRRHGVDDDGRGADDTDGNDEATTTWTGRGAHCQEPRRRDAGSYGTVANAQPTRASGADEVKNHTPTHEHSAPPSSPVVRWNNIELSWHAPSAPPFL
mmetsp:Transcript_33613/g.107330  ORF Transcript_33613/g.107330 Transcript_33613/m.107330 type:complete len:114 (-) Transcript_33613:9-350(-)